MYKVIVSRTIAIQYWHWEYKTVLTLKKLKANSENKICLAKFSSKRKADIFRDRVLGASCFIQGKLKNNTFNTQVDIIK